MNNCILCDDKLKITNISSMKYNNQIICTNCAKKLSKEKITLFNYKNYTIEQLKDAIYNQNVKDGTILECPKCKSHNLELLSNDKNYNTKYKTTINLNPLKLFTLTNTKEIKKEKSKLHNEYLCKDCGNRWIGK